MCDRGSAAAWGDGFSVSAEAAKRMTESDFLLGTRRLSDPMGPLSDLVPEVCVCVCVKERARESPSGVCERERVCLCV